MQSETLVILLQETHSTDAEKLVLPNYQLAGSSLSRKHGLATFVQKRLKYTLLDQSPPTSEIKWLCVDVDGYKIVNVYKPPPTRLRTLDLPVFPHPCLYAGDFNCRHADWGYDDNSPDGECLAGWASVNCLALLYNAKDAASFYSGRWNTGTNPDLGLPWISGPRSYLVCLLSGFSDTRQVRLRSRRPFVPAARNLLDNLARLGIRASEWQITNGKRSTVKILPGSVLLCPRPVPGLLGWAYHEQLGLSSTACGVVLGDSIRPCTNGVSLLHQIASAAPLSKPQTMY